MSRFAPETLNPSSAESVPPISRRRRWKRGAAMLAAATTLVATAGIVAPLTAAHAAAPIGVAVAGSSRPLVSFTDTADVVTLSGLSEASTGNETATFTQTAQANQPTGYTTYGTPFSATAAPDSGATAGSTTEPFDLTPTAFPPGYYDISVTDALTNADGACTRCFFVVGGTPTLTKVSRTNVAQNSTVGTPSGTGLTTSANQFALTGTNLNHDAAITSDDPANISFAPQTNGTTYTDEGASGLTVRYGLLTVKTGAKAGSHTLTVTDSDGGKATIQFTVDAGLFLAASAPLSPNTVGNGDINRLITVTGTGFTTATTIAVTANGTTNNLNNPASTVKATVKSVTPTVLVASLTESGSDYAAGDTGVTNGYRPETFTATNPDGGSASTPIDATGASPTVSSVSPAQLTPNTATATTLTITGTNFSTAAGTAATKAIQVVFPVGSGITETSPPTLATGSTTTITVPVTVAANAPVRVEAPTVINGDTGSGTCTNSCFQIATYTVTTGGTGFLDNGGSHAAMFTGNNLVPMGTTPTFTAVLNANPAVAGQGPIASTGTCPLTSNNTIITCTFDLTRAAPVNYDVTFTRSTDGATDTTPGGVGVFNVGNAKPAVTTPTPATIVGADLPRTLTLTGSGFANGATVTSSDADFTFGATTVSSATQLTVPVTLKQKAAAVTGATFTVTNADGTASPVSTGKTTVGTEPTLTTVSPAISYTIGNAGFSVPLVVDNSATGNAALTNEQVRLRLSGLTGLTASEVVASVNGTAVTPTTDGTTVVVPSPAFAVAAGAKPQETFLVKLVNGSPSGSLNIAPLLGDAIGTTVFPSTTADTQASAATYAVAVAGPPPTLTATPAPTQLVVGDPAASQTFTVVNNSGSRLNEGQLDIAVTGPAGLAASQLAVTSSTQPSSPVPLTLSNGSYRGVLDPAQIIQSGTTLNDTVTLALPAGAPLGSYSFVVTLDETDPNGVPDGTTLAGPISEAAQGVGIPTAPTALQVTAGNASLAVAFGAPASDGGDGLLTYVITATASGQPTVSVTATQSPVALTGLVNGVTYNVFVQAENNLNRVGAVVSALATPVAGLLPVPPSSGGIRSLNANLSKAFAPLGTRVTISGKLTAGLIGVPNSPVVIQTTYSDGKVVKLGTVTTKADGTYAYTFTPLYNGYLVAMAGTTLSKPVGSRVIVTFTQVRVGHSGSKITVLASTAPGFVTSAKRLERAQVLLVNGSGRILKVLAVVNATNRHSSPGQAHGVNDVKYTGTLPAGSYRIAVKIIGTPVNTGAQSGSVAFQVA